MSDGVLREEIGKRFTLNWLIQGAAQHAGMTFHHLIREELVVLNPELPLLYDKYALINLLQYWQPEAALFLGRPRRFWKKATTSRRHPFFGHLLLSKFGGTLAESGRRRALERCKEKNVTVIPIAFSFQTASLIARLRTLELPHRKWLIQLAKNAASTVWGISSDRLDADLILINKIVAPKTLPARSFRDAMFLAGLAGYGEIVRADDQLKIVARGTNWQLVTKELVKGTAELICLHGLNHLSDEIYQKVIHTTDRIELEPWMLQSGGELWRRLLASLPNDVEIAKVLMLLARLKPETLESVIAEVIERPAEAAPRLKKLCGPASP